MSLTVSRSNVFRANETERLKFEARCLECNWPFLGFGFADEGDPQAVTQFRETAIPP